MTTNRCAIVTGASRGIGRAVALRLAMDGYRVVGCCSQRSAAADETEAALRAIGPEHVLAVCDVRDYGAVEAFVKMVEQELGPVSAIVNNAGIARDNPIALMEPQQWRDVLDTNLTGTWNVCRCALYNCMKRGHGSVVNMSSVAGVYGNATQSNYAATKAGIIGMSKSLAKELARFSIRVNVVAPGFIETDMTSAMGEKAHAKALSAIPLKRFGTTSDVAELVAFLLSERAAYITGQVVQVDGGMVL